MDDRIVEDISDALLAGLTGGAGASRFSHDGKAPTSGYVVSDPGGHNHRLVQQAGGFQRYAVTEWVRASRTKGVILGSWASGGLWHLDVNDFLMSKSRAFLHAVIAGEDAIHDVAANEDVVIPEEFRQDPLVINARNLLTTYVSMAVDPRYPIRGETEQ